MTALRPWRELAEPHCDIADGSFDESLFGADLGLVDRGRGPEDYLDPVTFCNKTYLTSNLVLRPAPTGAPGRCSADNRRPVTSPATVKPARTPGELPSSCPLCARSNGHEGIKTVNPGQFRSTRKGPLTWSYTAFSWWR